jgi:hypothetical protein
LWEQHIGRLSFLVLCHLRKNGVRCCGSLNKDNKKYEFLILEIHFITHKVLILLAYILMDKKLAQLVHHFAPKNPLDGCLLKGNNMFLMVSYCE